ncbi:PREDICTED: uncharacterized protein LOC105449959 [Wasmannia auropunctata]|uniref:uncharacterized protein LOC105449959 n=1 Tax=Wasmannia auropunctata TaxID=64793 RepID=UPI0005EDA2F8|nr:PREDICTED: uncharacterized protein LOC105449959 [Wasmannia auropunctata]
MNSHTNESTTVQATPNVRDEYQLLSQAQVGACLNALGSGMSLLLRPEVLHSLNDEARSALTFFSEGIHLLSDHHYRLSLTGRAFTKPFLNIIGKNAADSAPIDEFLFGQNFAETLKAAQACEKTGCELARLHLRWGKRLYNLYVRQLSRKTSPLRPNQFFRETGGLLFVLRRLAKQELPAPIIKAAPIAPSLGPELDATTK